MREYHVRDYRHRRVIWIEARQTPEFMNGGSGSEATNTLNALSTRLGLPTLDHPGILHALLHGALWDLLQSSSGSLSAVGCPGDDQPSDGFHSNARSGLIVRTKSRSLSSWNLTMRTAKAVTDIRFTFRNDPLNVCSSAQSSCSAPLIS